MKGTEYWQKRYHEIDKVMVVKRESDGSTVEVEQLHPKIKKDNNREIKKLF